MNTQAALSQLSTEDLKVPKKIFSTMAQRHKARALDIRLQNQERMVYGKDPEFDNRFLDNDTIIFLIEHYDPKDKKIVATAHVGLLTHPHVRKIGNREVYANPLVKFTVARKYDPGAPKTAWSPGRPKGYAGFFPPRLKFVDEGFGPKDLSLWHYVDELVRLIPPHMLRHF